MSVKEFFLQTVLNLPAPEDRNPGRRKQEAAEAAQAAAVQAQYDAYVARMRREQEQRTAPPAANPWVASGAAAPTGPVPADPVPARQPVPMEAPTGVPWQMVEDTGQAKAWRRIGRTLIVIVLAFFVWIGARTAFFPDTAGDAVELPAAVTFDVAQAQGVATRFVTTAMTWNEDAPDTRSDGIGLDYVDGPSDLGWNGKGYQYVDHAIPGPVTVADDGKTAVVTVYASVRAYTREKPDQEWQYEGAEWSTFEVPVARTENGARLVATAAPAMTGQPAPASVPAAAVAPVDDGDLTRDTEAAATAFFTAYGEGDVSAVEAPGAGIAAPKNVWQFEALTSWAVEQADDPAADRTAHATVTWSVGGRPDVVTQTYRLTLTAVSAGGEDRWQVAAITAG